MGGRDELRKPKDNRRSVGISCERFRAAIGEIQIGPALMPPEPAERNGAPDASPEVVTAATCREERRVDLLDVDTTILHPTPLAISTSLRAAVSGSVEGER